MERGTAPCSGQCHDGHLTHLLLLPKPHRNDSKIKSRGKTLHSQEKTGNGSSNGPRSLKNWGRQSPGQFRGGSHRGGPSRMGWGSAQGHLYTWMLQRHHSPAGQGQQLRVQHTRSSMYPGTLVSPCRKQEQKQCLQPQASVCNRQ